MLYPRTSTPWLSDDMAQALAAMCPPLQTIDVLQAADSLASGSGIVRVIDQLLRQGADLLVVRRVVEALRALREARVSESSLAAWLLTRESDGRRDSAGLLSAAERVCQKLAPPLSQLISSTGTLALLARSLYVARAEFPFLERTGNVSPTRLLALNEGMDGVDPAEAGESLQAILGILLDLLVGFIGQDLTLSLVREVWSDLPVTLAIPTDGAGPWSNA